MKTRDILDRLIAFPTVSADSNLELIDWVQDLLDQAGFEVIRIYAPDRQKAGLFARIGPAIEGGLCLSAHTDVVPVAGQNWTRPAFRMTEEGGRVFGRGTTDMKGFLASALAAGLAASKSPLKRPLSLSISYDEEVGCVGIRHMMPEMSTMIGKPDVVIVGEPTGMRVATGHKGKTALSVSCHGTAGHSALAPQFTNAIYVASAFIENVQAFQRQLANGPIDESYSVPYSTLHVGTISGGRALNIVPDKVDLAMEFRTLAEANPRIILEELQAIARRTEAQFGTNARIVIEEGVSYPGLETVRNEPVVAQVCKLAGFDQDLKVSFGTEAGFFSDLGLTTLVIGPGDMDKDGHQADEGLDLQQLAACDQFLSDLTTAFLWD